MYHCDWIAQQHEARRVVWQLVAEVLHVFVDFVVGLGDFEGLFVDLVFWVRGGLVLRWVGLLVALCFFRMNSFFPAELAGEGRGIGWAYRLWLAGLWRGRLLIGTCVVCLWSLGRRCRGGFRRTRRGVRMVLSSLIAGRWDIPFLR